MNAVEVGGKGMTLLRAVKKRIPLSAKLRVRFHLHNALSRLPGSERVGLRVEQADGCWKVTERPAGRPSRSIGVTSFGRWVRFEKGIDHQLRRLARQYGVGTHFELGPGDVVVDIGANVGEFALYAAGVGARVVAVEADPRVGAILQRNTEDVPAIERFVQPIWSKDEKIDFYSSPIDAESSLIRPDCFDEVIRVDAVRLDTLTERAGLGRIKLVKCDAEGAEPEVLSGATATLARTDWISFDCGPERQGKATLDECRDLLERRGFEIVSKPVRPGARVILVARNTRA